jgi:hypothetical protein
MDPRLRGDDGLFYLRFLALDLPARGTICSENRRCEATLSPLARIFRDRNESGKRDTMISKTALLLPLTAALVLPGCASKTPTLPDDPIEKAASCGVITAASEREAAGVKGELPARAQERIFHYPLLAGSTGASFDNARAQAVFQRMPKLFETVIQGKWQTLKPACAAAFPQTQIAHPTLPARPLDSMLQCYVLTDFMRKSLGSVGGSYAEVSLQYGVFTAKLDDKVSAALAKVGIKNGPALQDRRAEALAAAAKLGQPSGVIEACMKKYGE